MENVPAHQNKGGKRTFSCQMFNLNVVRSSDLTTNLHKLETNKLINVTK